MKSTREQMEDAGGSCMRPDRHVPKLICGYPLPCSHHTVALDVAKKSIHLPAYAAPMPKQTWGRLSEILEALHIPGVTEIPPYK